MDSDDEYVEDMANLNKLTPVNVNVDIQRLMAGKSIETEFEIPDTQQSRANNMCKSLLLDTRTREKVQLKFLSDNDLKLKDTMVADNYDDIERIMDFVPNTEEKLKNLILRMGTGRKVELNDLVRIHYIVACESMDDLVESTYAQNRSKRFRIGMGQLLPVLDLGIRTMRVGGISKFLGAPELGFGELGVPLFNNVVPPNVRVLVQVELLDAIASKNDTDNKNAMTMTSEERQQLSFQDLLKYAEEIKDEGNREFKDEEFERARQAYLELLDCIKDMKPMTTEELNCYWKLCQTTQNNLALVCFKMGKFKASFKHAENGTNLPILEKEKYKSLYWCAKALFATGEFEKSLDYAKKAAQLCENDCNIRNLLNEIQVKIQQAKQEELKLCTKMFTASVKD